MTTIKNLTDEQVLHLQNLLNAKKYPEAYSYVKDLLSSSDKNVAKWFDIAAHINADDGSFYSDFVRSATIEAGSDYGTPINLTQFQNASDKLAEQVLSGIIINKGVPDLDTIINQDVKSVVSNLGLNVEGWAGTMVGSWPTVFGGLGLENESEFYTGLYNNWRSRGIDNFFEKMFLWSDILENNVAGLKDAILNDVADFLNDAEDFVQDFMDELLDDAQTISDFLQGALDDLLQSQVFVAPARRDPLSLDLDGDGIELVNVNESTAFFDLDVVDNGDGTYTSDGFKEQVGWVKGDDGIFTTQRL